MAGTFQIGGLVSGLDTNKIIDQLMALERQPLQRMQQAQQAAQDRKAALGDLSTKLSAARTKAMNLTLSSTSQGRTTSSSSTTVATATASANTAIQSFDLNVGNLATKTIATSGTAIGAPVNAGAVLNSGTAGLATTPTSGFFTLNGTTVTVDATADSLADVMNRINTTFGGTITAALDASGNKLVLSGTGGAIVAGAGGDTSNFLAATRVAAAPAVLNGGTGKWDTTSTGPLGATQPGALLSSSRLSGLSTASGDFTINGVNITWDSTADSLNSVISRINNSAANVVASYDATADKFTLKAKNTGATDITVADGSSGNLIAALFAGGIAKTLGQNAQYSIDGGPAQYSTSNVVSGAISGVSLSLAGAGTTTINVSQDVAGTVSAVKDFVTSFNDAIGLVRQQTAIDPATNQRSIFTGDSFIQGIEFRLRGVMSMPASGISSAYMTLPSIGISTGAVGASPGSTNTMVLDEAKLTQALQADPNSVTALLTSSTGPVSTLNTYLFGITSFTGPLNAGQSSADQNIKDLGNQIRDMQERLQAKQDALERKFADLESAMAQLQSQSQRLSAQLGQLGGSKQ